MASSGRSCFGTPRCSAPVSHTCSTHFLSGDESVLLSIIAGPVRRPSGPWMGQNGHHGHGHGHGFERKVVVPGTMIAGCVVPPLQAYASPSACGRRCPRSLVRYGPSLVHSVHADRPELGRSGALSGCGAEIRLDPPPYPVLQPGLPVDCKNARAVHRGPVWHCSTCLASVFDRPHREVYSP